MNLPQPLPDMPSRLRFLGSAAAHPGGTGPVELIETHMSWVFLARETVLKLKKPVRYAMLDFSTVSAREFYCREEVRLNARLAPGVYLGVRALQWQDGALTVSAPAHLSAAAQTLDWLVLMRRLPARQMLDQRIAAGQVTPEDIDALIGVLARFYRAAAGVGIAADAYVRQLQREQQLNRRLLLDPRWQLPGVAGALDRLDAALTRHAPALGERATAGRVLDGHGDLRPEHVCLQRPPVVIDRIEFNAALRQVDPFDELAFLGLECDVAGAPWIAGHLFDAGAAALGERPDAALLRLYTAWRALLRARLSMAHLLDAEPRTPQRWPVRARRYVQQAMAALDALDVAVLGR